eukprot:359135-Chlamydomonas_euryale.AAC.4
MEEQEDMPGVQEEQAEADRVGRWVQQTSPPPRRHVAQSWAARSWGESSASLTGGSPIRSMSSLGGSRRGNRAVWPRCSGD